MTRTAVEKVTLGVLTAVLTALLVPFIVGALTPKVTRADFQAHIRDKESKIDTLDRKVDRVEHKLDRLMDVVCDSRPRPHRSCNATGGAND